jgi:hypothetical protein
MASIAVPSVHMNGDTREELLRINRAAYDAATALIDALYEAAPNGRNFYPQGPDAMGKAVAQHHSRVNRAEGIKAELAEIVHSLMR